MGFGQLWHLGIDYARILLVATTGANRFAACRNTCEGIFLLLGWFFLLVRLSLVISRRHVLLDFELVAIFPCDLGHEPCIAI